MLKHDQIWTAVDALASRHGYSASGLAKRAGLDPTTFNRSKRLTPGGRQRWPSTESIAKILMATNESLDTFVSLISNSDGGLPRLPVIAASQAARPDAFNASGEPSGMGWDEVALTGVLGHKCFALDIDQALHSALYREGTLLIAAHGAQVRRGDRVIAKHRDGRILIGEVRRETATTLELAHCGSGTGPEMSPFSRNDILWLARIHWASQ